MCPADFGPDEAERLAARGWWRLRDRRGDGSRFTLLVDLADVDFIEAYLRQWPGSPGPPWSRERLLVHILQWLAL